jgi:hypothetical protein
MLRLPRLAPLVPAGRRCIHHRGAPSGGPSRYAMRCAGAAALTGSTCALLGSGGPTSSVQAASAANESTSSWLPAKPGGGQRDMPPPDPAGRPRVIFQGELGAYGETAIDQHFTREGAIPVPCDNFESVRAHAQSGQILPMLRSSRRMPARTPARPRARPLARPLARASAKRVPDPTDDRSLP